MPVAHDRGFRNFCEATQPISGKLPITQLILFNVEGAVCGQQNAIPSEGLVWRPLVEQSWPAASCRRIARKTGESRGPLRIKLASIMVDNQDKGLKFYTEIFGFVTKHDIPVGGGLRWITVVSPEAVDGA